MSMTSGHQATIAELRAMFQLKSWQGIYGRIQADIDASHRGHSSTPLTRGGLAHCWLRPSIGNYEIQQMIHTMKLIDKMEDEKSGRQCCHLHDVASCTNLAQTMDGCTAFIVLQLKPQVFFLRFYKRY